MSSHLQANVERFSGFADCYDANRPQPPAVCMDMLCQVAGVARPRLVVDLGSGTGLSTTLWLGRVEQVVGIEPNPDMRRQAEARTRDMPGASGISYRGGLSTATGLPEGCADIVTCSQSLHWMEPEPTFAEVARILRDGGVFAAIDCDWPPLVHWEVEAAYAAMSERVHRLEREYGVSQDVRRWAKHEHLARIRESGRFRYTREALAHSVEQGSAARLVGLARSQGGIASLVKTGVTEREIGLDDLSDTAHRALGDGPVPFIFSYRIRLGVK